MSTSHRAPDAHELRVLIGQWVEARTEAGRRLDRVAGDDAFNRGLATGERHGIDQCISELDLLMTPEGSRGE